MTRLRKAYLMMTKKKSGFAVFKKNMEESTSMTTACTNEKVMMLYDTALAIQRSHTKQGILVLDCTIKRVKVNENMFEKVAQLQEQYQSKGKNIIAIVYTGKGVLYHFLGQCLDFTACAGKNNDLRINSRY
jgi:hypothetical protein